MTTAPNQTTNKANEGLALLARLFWMFFGNAALAFSLLIIVIHKQDLGQSADFVFWPVVTALMLVRYLDIKFCSGSTATGAPATIDHWYRYIMVLLVCSLIAWSIAHVYVYFMSKYAV